jgi:hypothetical protein
MLAPEPTEYMLQVNRRTYWQKVTQGTFTEVIRERLDPYWEDKETRVLELKKRIMTEEELK